MSFPEFRWLYLVVLLQFFCCSLVRSWSLFVDSVLISLNFIWNPNPKFCCLISCFHFIIMYKSVLLNVIDHLLPENSQWNHVNCEYLNAVLGNISMANFGFIDPTHSHANENTIFHHSTIVTDNNSHPLYPHNNDQPGMVLISKKLGRTENYASWKHSMQIALSAKCYWRVVCLAWKISNSCTLEESKWYSHTVITWAVKTVSDISISMSYMHSAFNVGMIMMKGLQHLVCTKSMKQKGICSNWNKEMTLSSSISILKGYWDELKSL